MNEIELKKLVKEFFENELSIYENDLKMRPLRDRQYEIKQILAEYGLGAPYEACMQKISDKYKRNKKC